MSKTIIPEEEKVITAFIEEEMKTSYLDYAMSVIVGRALPDVRDGLKPVHRRILYAMSELGLSSNKPHKKSARAVGEVLGKYHPHGDVAVYDAMVRLAQNFSSRYPLVNGQGNFGSIDGDPPAAMRYTEVRLAAIAEDLLADIEAETIDWAPNFDASLKEPVVLPALPPNLLINGSSGIAVGMATNIPPHNLKEVVAAIIALIDNPKLTLEELLEILPGPDFPTGAYIFGRDGIVDAYRTGRGTITLRAKAAIEEPEHGKDKIIITEIPYYVNKTNLITKIVEVAKEKELGLSEVRDESDRDGMRIVLEVKRDENPQVILNQLYKHTQLQTAFGIINLALVNGMPKVLPIMEMINLYIEHRLEIITKRSKYQLRIAEERAHILEGLKIALAHIDEVIQTIRSSKDTQDAKNQLVAKFSLSIKQAQAILEMQLGSLTKLSAKKLDEEYLELIKKISYLNSILASRQKMLEIIKTELKELASKFGDERRTEIIAKKEDFRVEDFIEEEDVIITISNSGYIKRIPISIYKKQKRGGVGVTGAELKEEDFIKDLYIASTHDFLLFFTSQGRLYWLKVHQIPEAGRLSKGKAMVNVLNILPGETIASTIPIREFDERFVIMATEGGIIKKTPLNLFKNLRAKGIIAMGIREGDRLLKAELTSGTDEVILATAGGKALRFSEKDLRPIGRVGSGVIGIRFEKDNRLVGMEVMREDRSLLSITANGFGKRTDVSLYRLQKRGGKGVLDIKTNERNGLVVSILEVKEDDEVVVITSSGMVIRMPVSGIRLIKRNTKGVSIVRLRKGDKVVACAPIVKED
ncbi:MAG: DNA gyrase subunit A [bacterium]|nr:DNA gyrase subunit A [bacterium]